VTDEEAEVGGGAGEPGQGSSQPAQGAGRPSWADELLALLRGALDDLRAMRDSAVGLARVRADRARVRLWKLGFLVVLALGLVAALLGVLAGAGALFVVGLAGALTRLLAVPSWAGALLAAAATLLGAVLLVLLARRVALRRLAKQLEARYAARAEADA
jgi:hypothetical protein